MDLGDKDHPETLTMIGSPYILGYGDSCWVTGNNVIICASWHAHFTASLLDTQAFVHTLDHK